MDEGREGFGLQAVFEDHMKTSWTNLDMLDTYMSTVNNHYISSKRKVMFLVNIFLIRNNLAIKEFAYR